MALIILAFLFIFAFYAVNYIRHAGPIDNPVVTLIFRAIHNDLPYRESMAKYLEFMLPKLRRFSESLHDMSFYTNKRWLEVRDDDNFHETILHIFKPEQSPMEIKVFHQDEGATYLYSINGNITRGTWVHMQGNGMIIKLDPRFELYDLAFLSDDFMILRKNGEQYLQPQYLFLINERLGKGLTWREALELVYDIYRYNLSYLFTLTVGLVFVLVILYFSFIR